MNEEEGFESSTIEARWLLAPKRRDMAFALRVVEGPDRGAVVAIDGTSPLPILIGKSPACAARLSDPQVSRRHAEVDLAGGRLRIRDLGSTNGTFLDNVSIAEGYAKGGELLRMGASALLVEAMDVAPAQPATSASSFGRYLGASAAMRRLYPLCERLAASTVPVVVEGETGTGKEQLAQAIHEMGPRGRGPFVVFDCTAVAPSLIETELFGHEKGAFTGAVGARRGVFELAQGGTLLIDEIGDMPLELQAKLLRVLDRNEVRRVGGERPISVDARILVATRRNLDREVQLGRFRDDLFHRLTVARLELPPLRRREGDVVLLATHFCGAFGAPATALPSDLLRRWEEHEWPGNVRELRNSVARWLALGDLAPAPPAAPSTEPEVAGPLRPVPQGRSGDVVEQILAMDLPLADAREKILDAFEARYVARMLASTGGNVTRAAAASGVARRHFQRLKARRLDGTPDDDAT